MYRYADPQPDLSLNFSPPTPHRQSHAHRQQLVPQEVPTPKKINVLTSIRSDDVNTMALNSDLNDTSNMTPGTQMLSNR